MKSRKKERSGPPTPAEIERVARAAARRGSAILKKYFGTGIAVRHKGEINLVTQADVESQDAIVRTIARAFPKHNILAEEGDLGHQGSLDGPIWIIDPLDGTTNFAHGFPVFAISIAFRNEGRTEFGLVHQPLLNEWFIAHRGKGATLNGKRIHVSKRPDITQSLLATGFPYDHRTSPDNNLNYFSYFELMARCVRRAGAAALDLAYVAAGRFDGFWELRLAPWDVAAGTLLVEEAGGRVSVFDGSPLVDLRCDQTLASNGLIHDDMVKGLAIARPQSVTIRLT